jgi:ABC-type sugar transport system permease subunit
MNWKKFCEVLLLLLTAVAVVIAITMWVQIFTDTR